MVDALRNLTIYIPSLWGIKNNDCSDKISKTGDTMQGTLDMSFNRIINLSNLVDVDPSDACSGAMMRRYVDFKAQKPVITVLADVKTRKWCGYTMPTNGRVTHGTLSLSETALSRANLLVNDRAQPRHQIIKPAGPSKIATKFNRPLELQQGDVLNFKIVVNNRPKGGAVSVLIELDF